MTSLDVFSELHHVCIVVRDLEASTAYYESLGIGPWHEYPSLAAYELEAVRGDRKAYLALRYRYAKLGNVQLQLCAPPPGDTAQRRFLEEKGEGVYHLGFSVPDCDAAEKQARGVGLGVRAKGRLPDRTGFTYFETENAGAGVTLEIRSSRKLP
ncbi:MAG: VOC family protein [Burkholderiaceae bacterium]|jgi:catechol 2,3-dioxygenase-like lactoylglutathione lyase family enzyme